VPSASITFTSTTSSAIDLAVALPTPTGPDARLAQRVAEEAQHAQAAHAAYARAHEGAEEPEQDRVDVEQAGDDHQRQEARHNEVLDGVHAEHLQRSGTTLITATVPSVRVSPKAAAAAVPGAGEQAGLGESAARLGEDRRQAAPAAKRAKRARASIRPAPEGA